MIDASPALQEFLAERHLAVLVTQRADGTQRADCTEWSPEKTGTPAAAYEAF